MMACLPSFTVRRHPAVLIPPSSPTPNELKRLSDIDDQQSLRYHVHFIHYYRAAQPSSTTHDPTNVIRRALADALVFYYPLAGRVREGPDNKLLVDCTAEGVLFIEADADVRLDDFGEALMSPIPCVDELLPGPVGIIGCPLLAIQMTRLLCGGFILALRVNHTIADGHGTVQFLTAVSEIARGAESPSVLPVWERHLLSARVPPRITHAHPEFDAIPPVMDSTATELMVYRSFFFTKSEVSKLKCYSPTICSTFDVLAASLWRSRTAAYGVKPADEVRLYFTVNARGRIESMVPLGYYGNAFIYPAVISTAGELCGRPLGYAVELVRKAKESVTEGFIRSVVDLMVLRGRQEFAMTDTEHTCFISENVRTGFDELDFGWGKPVFGGTADGAFPELVSLFVRFRDGKGEEGVVVPVCLPEDAMERFVAEIEGLIGGKVRELHNHP